MKIQFPNIAIVGTGAMGRGIAQIAAQAGSQVFLLVGDVPGDYELRFVLKRAWENQVRNSRRVLFQVRGADRRALSS